MTLTYTQEIALASFIQDYKEGVLEGHLYVRGQKRAYDTRCSELRTKKNDDLARLWSDDSCFALKADGTRLQLIGKEADY